MKKPSLYATALEWVESDAFTAEQLERIAVAAVKGLSRRGAKTALARAVHDVSAELGRTMGEHLQEFHDKRALGMSNPHEWAEDPKIKRINKP
jgi:hypothetical protein